MRQVRTEYDDDIDYKATQCDNAILSKLTIVTEPGRSNSFKVVVECLDCPSFVECTFFASNTAELMLMLEWILKKPARYPTWSLPKFIKL